MLICSTGASSGIGAATALLFSKLGASLSLTGRNLPNLNEVAEKCQSNCGSPTITIQGHSKKLNNII